MPPDTLQVFRSLAERAHGIVLATGPTGSVTFTVTGSTAAVAHTATANLNITPLNGGCPGGALLCNLNVRDTANASHWSLQTNLQVGNLAYGDRTYTFRNLPAPLPGSAWIRTAGNSKTFRGNPLVSFDVGRQATVYVLMDRREARPAWLDSSWTDTGTSAAGSEGVTYELWRKGFGAGTVALGPTAAPKGASMITYTVIVQPATAP